MATKEKPIVSRMDIDARSSVLLLGGYPVRSRTLAPSSSARRRPRRLEADENGGAGSAGDADTRSVKGALRDLPGNAGGQDSRPPRVPEEDAANSAAQH